MKTPMQELIEQLKRLKYSEINEQAWDAYDSVMDIAEALLEKEKEVIIEASKNSYIAGYLDNQAKVDDSMNFPEEYYNQTFNAKEK